MSINIVLILAVGVLFGCGIYMLLEGSLTKVLLGFLLVSNGANLMILHMGGESGPAPISKDGVAPEGMNDPLPQALILTAIVITFGITAFVLSLIYRSWRLARGDQLTRDEDDRLISRGAVDIGEGFDEARAVPSFGSDDPDAVATGETEPPR
jgi:multisubunit Na+/H+ antiporter MnhC subunit